MGTHHKPWSAWDLASWLDYSWLYADGYIKEVKLALISLLSPREGTRARFYPGLTPLDISRCLKDNYRVLAKWALDAIYDT